MAPKKCKTGKSCGMGCISPTKTCRVQLSPQVNKVLDLKAYSPPEGGFMHSKKDFTSSGTEVKALIIEGQVMFAVGSTMDRDKAKVPDPIAAGKLAISLTRELISSLPENTVIWNEPFREDSGGDARIRVYQKLGFGDLIDNKAQWAIKREGHLVPVTREFYEANIKGREKELKGK